MSCLVAQKMLEEAIKRGKTTRLFSISVVTEQKRKIKGFLAMDALFITGSITPTPQPGNPKPRVFRIPELK